MSTIITTNQVPFIDKFPTLASLAVDSSAKSDEFRILLGEKSSSESQILDGFETASISGMGLMAKGGETTPYTYDAPNMEFVKRTRYMDRRIAASITDTVIRRNAYGYLETIFDEIGKSYNRTKNTDVAILMDNAFNSTFFTAPDGLPILSVSHKSNRNPGMLRANCLQTGTVLEYGSLQNLLTVMMRQKDAQGFPNPAIRPGDSVKLVVPPSLYFTAKALLHEISYYNPTNGNNDANVLHDFTWDIIQNPWLQNETQWFLLGSDHKEDIFFVDEVPFDLKNDRDPYNDAELVKGHASYLQHVKRWESWYGAGQI